jgi:hypothetical protein
MFYKCPKAFTSFRGFAYTAWCSDPIPPDSQQCGMRIMLGLNHDSNSCPSQGLLDVISGLGDGTCKSALQLLENAYTEIDKRLTKAQTKQNQAVRFSILEEDNGPKSTVHMNEIFGSSMAILNATLYKFACCL